MSGRFVRSVERARLVRERGQVTAGLFWKDKIPAPDISRLVAIALPFTIAASKNAVYRYTRKGGTPVYLNERTRLLAAVARGLIQRGTKERGITWNRRKTYLEILVEKPTHQSDAINVVDVLADAVKVAIGVDDRWFSLLRVDWTIVKYEPRIYLAVGQEEGGDQYICSVCGLFKESAEMVQDGKHTECRSCNAAINTARWKSQCADCPKRPPGPVPIFHSAGCCDIRPPQTGHVRGAAGRFVKCEAGR